jgi:hypothetical protein
MVFIGSLRLAAHRPSLKVSETCSELSPKIRSSRLRRLMSSCPSATSSLLELKSRREDPFLRQSPGRRPLAIS